MDRIVFVIGDISVTLGMLAVAAGSLFALLLAGFVILGLRQSRAREREVAERSAEAQVARSKNEALERQLAGMLQGQYEMNARMQTMSEIFGTRTSDLMRSVNERIDAQGQRVGQALTDTNTKTAESLSALNERLAVIDRAQAGMAELGKDMVSLQSILSNKQTRGAFGQGRMEAIITDHLPAGAFAFQYHAFQQQAARLRGVHAQWGAQAGDRREVPARSLGASARRANRHRPQAGDGFVPQRHRLSRAHHRRELPAPRRDAGHGFHVRAVGIDLCRHPRALRRQSCRSRCGRAW